MGVRRGCNVELLGHALQQMDSDFEALLITMTTICKLIEQCDLHYGKKPLALQTILGCSSVQGNNFDPLHKLPCLIYYHHLQAE